MLAKTVRYSMSGGPFDGRACWLTTPGTLVFTLGKWKGYYDVNNKWVDVS